MINALNGSGFVADPSLNRVAKNEDKKPQETKSAQNIEKSDKLAENFKSY